jgi:hypothetical protein
VRVDALELVDDVQMQRARLDRLGRLPGEPVEVGAGVSALEVAELGFLRDQHLRALEIAVDEDVQRQAQRRHEPRVQLLDLPHARLGERAPLRDLLLLQVVDDVLDDVADVLEVDGEGHDLGPAAALALVQRLAADLRQVQLDRGVQLVHHVVHALHLARELAVVRAHRLEHPAEHPLHDVADAQRLARRVGKRERRRLERRRIEVAGARASRLVRIVGQQALHEPRRRRGEEDQGDRKQQVEGGVEVHHQALRIRIEPGEDALDRAEQRNREQAPDRLEEEIAERDASAGRPGAGGGEHRQQAAAEVRPDHQEQRHLQADQAARDERRGQQHDREARPGEHREEGADQQVEERIPRERAEDHLDARRLGDRARRLQDHLQREDDQSDADRDAADLTGARRLPGKVQDDAHPDRHRREPRQVEGEDLHHQARADVRAEHDRERGGKRHQVAADEGADDECGRGGGLDQCGDANAGEKGFPPVGDALSEHAAQAAAEHAQHPRTHDVRAPDEERDAGQDAEQRLHA